MVPQEAILSFPYGGPHELEVVLRAPNASEQAIGHKSEHAFCSATSRWLPNPDNREMFTRILSNAILSAEDEEEVQLEYLGPVGRKIRLPGLSEFPQHFKSFLESIRSKLADYARRTVSVLRWRTNLRGPHNPISSRGLHWSFDNDFWHPAPTNFEARLRMSGGRLRVAETIRQQVEQLVHTGESEPLHHDLLREAWEQHGSNPRSALVVGMAAAELLTPA